MSKAVDAARWAREHEVSFAVAAERFGVSRQAIGVAYIRLFGRTRPPRERTSHGHAVSTNRQPSRTYNSWAAMIKRCTDPRDPAFVDYGGRGISVCDRWRSFPAFLEDMGERPPGLTLDRFPDNNGNYEPGNCRWATASEQNQNRRPQRNRKLSR